MSAEVNYGIRFTSHSDAYKFIGELAAEVESRLTAIKMKGKCITLKLKASDINGKFKTIVSISQGVQGLVTK